MIEVYQDCVFGDWCCHAVGSFSDGFPTREAALEWALARVEPELERLWEMEASVYKLVAEANELIGDLIDTDECSHPHYDKPCPDGSLYCDFTRRAVAILAEQPARTPARGASSQEEDAG